MTVSANDAISTFITNGVTTAFTYDFPCDNSDELKVYLDNVEQVSGYTVNLTSKTVTFTSAPASGQDGVIARFTQVTQQVDYSRTSNSVNLSALGAQLDEIVYRVQELDRDITRAIKVNFCVAETAVPDPESDKLLGWNTAATKLVNKTAAQLGLIEVIDDDTMALATALNIASAESVREWVRARCSSVKDDGAVGDGTTNDTTPLLNWTARGKFGYVPTGSYSAPGSVGAPPSNRLIIADEATIQGASIPYLSISRLATKLLPKTMLYVRQDTTDRNDAVTARVDRIVNTDDGLGNTKALRVTTVVNVDTSQTEWAISGELTNYSDTTSTGNTAVSGVSSKYGLGAVFAGHFQALDFNKYAAATDVTAIIGAELNLPVIGLDHPTYNNGLGLRRIIDVLAATNFNVSGWDTNDGTNYGNGETGVGVLIRTRDDTTSGYFRYGLAVDDVSQTVAAAAGIRITNAILVRTGGARGMLIDGPNTSAGIEFGSNFTSLGCAIKMRNGQYIALDNGGTRRVDYTSGTDRIRLLGGTGSSERVGFLMSSTPALYLNGVKVVTTQQTAIADAAGGTEITTINAILAALRTHGLIAT